MTQDTDMTEPSPYTESTASSSTITLNDALPPLPSFIKTPSDAGAAHVTLSGRIIHAVASDLSRQSALWTALEQVHTQGSWQNTIVAPLDMTANVASLGTLSTAQVNFKDSAKEYTQEILNPLLNYASGGNGYQQSRPVDPHTLLKWWTAYTHYNQVFADAVAKIWAPGDLVYVHTHELYLMPAMLRSKLPDAHIGVYLASFPSSELYRRTVHRDALLVGLLGASVVAGRSEGAVRHFLSSCARVLGRDVNGRQISEGGRSVSAECVPLGLALGVEHEQSTAGVEARAEQLKQEFAGRKIVVARERHGAGAAQQLRAWDWFLASFPQWVGKTVLLQVLSGRQTKTDADEEATLVAQMNDKFGAGSAHTFNTNEISQLEYLAMLSAADTGLVACTCDRINTTAFQFVDAQQGKHAPVILGESMAAAAMLVDAVHVNPWDADGVARALQHCLTMAPAARATLSGKVYASVYANRSEVFWWRLASYIVQAVQQQAHRHATPALDVDALAATYKAAGEAGTKRLFLFDYDGTLTPIVRDPAAALPSPQLLKIVTKLASDPLNEMWVISGRDSAFLDQILGHVPGLGFSSEHGCFLKPPSSTQWVNLASKIDMRGWQSEVLSIFKHFTSETQGSSIESKHAALTWHYRRADPDFGQVQADRCFEHLQATVAQKWGSEIEVMAGKKNVEVRPRAFNKGEIVRSIVTGKMAHQVDADAEGKPQQRPGFVMCAGDDMTDEDMFKALADVEVKQEANAEPAVATKACPSTTYTLKVGSPALATTAHWQVNDPTAVLGALAVLADES